MNNFKIGKICFLLTLFYIAILQFYNLGKLPIVQWDESRLAVNAAEMYLNKSYIVTTYDNQADLWNTKPPLMIWLQTLSISCFGINEFAIRFPSAIAGFLCILMLSFLVFNRTKSLIWASLSMLILASVEGFIQLHGSMTGDYDALLSLFVLLSVVSFVLYLEHQKIKYIIGFSISIALAVLSKSAAAFIILPFFVLATLMFLNLKSTKIIILAIIVAIIPFVFFVIYRTSLGPEYLKQMWQNDFGGRFSTSIEGHNAEWYYYLFNLADIRLSYIVFLYPIAVFMAFFNKNKTDNAINIFILGYLLVLSISKTKIHWYDMPVLALIVYQISCFISDVMKLKIHKGLKLLFIIPILSLIIYQSYLKFNFITKHEGLKLSIEHYELSEFLRTYKKKEPLRYISLNYDAEYYFYTKNNTLITKGVIGTMKAGEQVVFQNYLEPDFNLAYEYQVLSQFKGVKCVRILKIKPKTDE